MFILRDILLPLQYHFSETTLGRERASLFVYTILSIIVPFTSSMTSNLWRCLDRRAMLPHEIPGLLSP
ncbi:hypothetical protein [Bathymodiolus platifrons methanotrophic gill symbiont]|uniref:hypothetical protein n=1 Tax=Bathymodiolus platifrons methanotrophic gill symbiont TaxID=113268 RepID=UPI001C8D20DF|nr:hypothetical protein [Bathymodiolus platifrons methanotrophic gill symbiont]